MNMDFGANKAPIELIKEGAFKGLILEIFLLASKVNGTKHHGKNLMS